MNLKAKLTLFCILIALTLVGTIGFMTIEGWTFLESLYMTIITLTTIGYGEVKPLSEIGKIFNILLMCIGVGMATFTLTRFMAEILSIDFDKRRRAKMNKEVKKLSGHTIVCGFGRMGTVICQKLSHYGTPFVVIEKRPSLIEELKKTNYLFIEGDAANDDHLVEAGVQSAKALVSVIDNDSDGLYIALAGRSLNEKLFIIVRANEAKAKKRMIRAGANKVILPFIMSGQKVADTIMNPATEDLFDITEDVTKAEGSKIQLADLFVTKSSNLNGQTLKDMGDQLKNLIIIGIKDDQNDFTFKPDSTYQFKEGDCLIAMGPKKDYEEAKSKLHLG
ncbi:MAG: potassium channel family protein [Bacteriovoracaceae bacterium]